MLAIFAVAALPSEVHRWLLAPVRRRRRPEAAGDPLQAVRGAALRQGGGAYLGLTSPGQMRFARAQRAVLLLGPPRSGKTSGVIVPALLSHPGPAVSTSTKPDVWRATSRVRGGDGQVWVFDPTGAGRPGRRAGAALVAGAGVVVVGRRAADRARDDHEHRRRGYGPLALGQSRAGAAGADAPRRRGARA